MSVLLFLKVFAMQQSFFSSHLTVQFYLLLLQFSNFFNWLLKCVKVLMSEPSDQLLPFSRFGN